MRTAARICFMLMAGALAGCQSVNGVQFVASNPDSVLLDYAADPPTNLSTANDTAVQQCQIFNRRTAVLESRMRTERRMSGSERGGEKPAAETRPGAHRLLHL